MLVSPELPNAYAIAGGTAWAGLQSVPQSAAGFLSSNADEPGVVTNYIAIFSDLTEHKASAHHFLNEVAQHAFRNIIICDDALAQRTD